MLTRFTASFTALIVVFGCGGTSGPSAPSNLPIAPPSSPPGISDDTPVVTAISPATTAAGSQQITLSVSGTNFVQRSPIQALVRWTTATGADVYLATRFVSSTEVSATVPATLLKTEGTAEIAVVNGDSMSISDGFTRYPTSNASVDTQNRQLIDTSKPAIN